ncbi:helix-hairpin-helix domain-containing protein [Nocardiopsis sp. EMB25]|uniref:helix-hairpin-helix domain-containing protein n=1 Tax=Nocardiopsis sp. EMB25 TaxID=2835867 RepID=UPI002284B476|nr:helix-hairpin-helix domain-containing protein [Nocardiopsis sp. EMB25]MCY9782703.1 helix-hairpin-helix domain-containing protein [Nocardiopsis sp. EMB25]
MTLQRRVRRHSCDPDPRERLRALAMGTAPASRPRPTDPNPSAPVPPGSHAHDPCPPTGDAGRPSPGGPAIPSAPYAMAAPTKPPDTAKGTRSPWDTWTDRVTGAEPWSTGPEGTGAGPPGPGGAPETVTERGTRAAVSEAGRPADTPPDTTAEHRDRHDRPPSGYEEIRPEPSRSLLARITDRWPVGVVPSRRAVLALTVLGLIAVGAALLALRDRPEEVTAEVVAAASPAADAGEVATAGTGTTGPETAGAEGTHGTGGTAPREDLVVHVGGEVAEPGLYTVPPGSRVADAVEEAGGALPDADLDTLNLARPLVDGEQVLVGVPSVEGAGEALGSGRPVNINRADVTALTRLPRIGEVIAAEIVAHRETHGPFASVDALVGVNGIGDRTLETLRPHVTVG